MRIPARLWWIPAAVTVAGMTYLGMVRISQWQADSRLSAVVPAPNKPFVPPPAKHGPVRMPEPESLAVPPSRPAPPVLPSIELPPFHIPKIHIPKK
jgi:hypothetical protein